MSLNAAIILNAILALGVVLGLGAVMLVPFTLDRREDDANVSALASPRSEDLAA
jgi:hypothetical protein